MNQRSVAILDQILKSDSYISEATLSNLFNVSRRTIYNDLDRINDWLKKYNSELKRVRGQGLYLESSLRYQILENEDIPTVVYYEFSKEERKSWTYIYLVGQHKDFFLQDFQNLFQVSRNTVIDDIKVLKEELNSGEIELLVDRKRGYEIRGDEIEIRKCLIQYVAKITPLEQWFSFLKNLEKMSQYSGSLQPYAILSIEDIFQIKHYLDEYEQMIEIEITDDVRNHLLVWFYFFIQRIKQENYAEVDPAEKDVIHTTEEFIGAKRLCEGLSNYFKLNIPTSEVVYFTRYLLSAKVNYNLNLQLESQEMRKLTSVVKKMVYEFQKYAAVDFPEPQRMIHNLLLHLKPTYYRKKYGIHIQNVLKRSIEKNYPEIFHLTKNVIHHVEDLVGQKIDENEIAFIAMHFGGWLRKEGVVLESKRKKMLIVCTNGLGTSRLLESQLEGLFSDVDITSVISLREYEETDDLSEIADFIVSTTLLPDRGVTVFVVEPILSNDDKAQLLKKVSSLYESNFQQQMTSVDTLMDIVSRYTVIQDEQSLKYELKNYFYSSNMLNSKNNMPGLLELLPESRVEVKNQVKSWEEAIFVASRHLLNQGFITKNYIEEMIRIVKNDGPYIVISAQIALPHANAEEDVNKTGMSMLFLKNEVDLLGKPVRMFIVLASVDNEQHLKALSELTKLFSDKATKGEILKTRSKTELNNLLKTYLKTIND